MTNTFRRASNATLKVARPDHLGLQHFTLQRVGATSPAVLISTGHCQLGSHALNEIELADPTVSRFHCEISVDHTGPWLKDVGSSNGTEVDGLLVREAYLRDGALIKLGPNVALRFKLLKETSTAPVSRSKTFGPLIGESLAMRACYAQLERAAETSRPVLLEGETGTGKSVAAEAIHVASSRADGPFISIDCAALTPADLEASLMGRDNPRRISAFEEAGGGTLFLDEVADLSNELQGRLLPVLERGELRRQGSSAVVQVRARLIAATREDLRQRVNDGRFRSELYYRLAVLKVFTPPLRRHCDDIPELVDQYLESAGVTDEEAAPLRTPDFLTRLELGAWPGNVRELLNHLERCVTMQTALLPHDTLNATPAHQPVDVRASYAEARRLALERFEHGYAEALLAAHQGNVSGAARAAGMDRAYLHRLMRRHGLK